MCDLLVCVSNLAPQIGVVLLAFRYNASLATVTGNPSEQFLPKAIYPLTTSNECGGKDRTFNRSDGAYREMFIDVQID
jgi:hypothetical protein